MQISCADHIWCHKTVDDVDDVDYQFFLAICKCKKTHFSLKKYGQNAFAMYVYMYVQQQQLKP